MHRGSWHIRPTRAEIDLAAVCDNAALLADIAGVDLHAVVKADAYGHGAIEVAGALQRSGRVAGFAVSLIEEGVVLRDAGIEQPILVMGPALAGGYDALIDFQLTAILSDPGDLDGLAEAARKRDVQVVAHLKFDTGMGRLGISPRDRERVLTRARSLDQLAIRGLSTHFACADEDDPDDPECLTATQLARFDDAVADARRLGLTPRVLHTANSAATLRFPAARRDFVRCGLALYGNGPGPFRSQAGPLQQAMRLVTHVAQIRRVDAGSTVSYGALWRAERSSRLAVIPIGYADGVPRRATGRAQVLIAGQRFPVVGAVSMDICVVDVTESTSRIEVGDEVVLLGSQGESRITAREYASWAACTEYEVTCGVSRRVPRRYAQER